MPTLRSPALRGYYVAEEGNYEVSPGFRIIRDLEKLINVSNDKIPGLIQVFQHLAPSPGVYYEEGENILDFSTDAESADNRSHVNGTLQEGEDENGRRSLSIGTGHKGTIYGSGRNNYAIFHETGHFPIVKESGFMWVEPTMDSVDRLTISHSAYFPFNNGDSSIMKRDHSHFKEKILYEAIDEKLYLTQFEKLVTDIFQLLLWENPTLFSQEKYLRQRQLNAISFNLNMRSWPDIPIP